MLCQRNGKLGFMGEHSLMDGMPAVGLCDHIQKLEYGKLKEKYNNDISDESLPHIQNIFEDAFMKMNEQDLKSLQKIVDEGKIECL